MISCASVPTSSVGSSGGTRPTPATCPGGGRTPVPGRSWSANSCCSRHPSSGSADPWQAWIDRWPTPASLAAAPAGEAVRAWGRLGYPRRALRLHQAATMITERFDGQVPDDRAALLSLPGVGSYTAAAIGSFAFGQREIVLDTNVRRVLARVVIGEAYPAAAPSREEIAIAEDLAPQDPRRAARWAVASMELGALVCTARSPKLCRLPGGRLLHLAPGRLSGMERPAPTRPELRRHRSAVPRRAAGGAALQRRAGRRRRTRHRLGRPDPTGALPRLAARRRPGRPGGRPLGAARAE